MFKKVFQAVLVIFAIFIVASIFMAIGGVATLMSPPEPKVVKKSIMAIELSGIIMDSREFVDTLAKYRKDDQIKGILININSPGGVVGPSQEIFAEIQKTTREYKKPVYAYCGGVCASGAYYSAVGADLIYTTPGAIIGSIGVIMEMVNLEKLYSWARVERYALTTGPFKDAGAEYKPLTAAQRALFQEMLDKVLGQFKRAIAEGRKMEMQKLDKYADGRVFTGEDAVALGFADRVGTWEDARRALGEAVGLGADPEVFKPRKKKGFYALLEEGADVLFKSSGVIKNTVEHVFHPELRAKPLFILPGVIGL